MSDSSETDRDATEPARKRPGFFRRWLRRLLRLVVALLVLALIPPAAAGVYLTYFRQRAALSAAPDVLAKARLNGKWRMVFTITKDSEDPSTVGLSGVETWTMTADCPSGPCNTRFTKDTGQGVLTFDGGAYRFHGDGPAPCEFEDGSAIDNAYARRYRLDVRATRVEVRDDAPHALTLTGTVADSATPTAEGARRGCTAYQLEYAVVATPQRTLPLPCDKVPMVLERIPRVCALLSS